MRENPILRLLRSSKALVVMSVTGVTFWFVHTGKASFVEAEGFLKFVLGPWLLAQGVEDAAKHYATGKSEDTRKMTESVRTLTNSLRPPAVVVAEHVAIEGTSAPPPPPPPTSKKPAQETD